MVQENNVNTKVKLEKHWYAVYTKPRWEKKVNGVLLQKQINSWCPLQKVEKQWSDRKKIVEEPLFKSYVFVFIGEAEKPKVLMTDGVLNFVHYLGKPAVVRQEEISLIQQYLADKSAKLSLVQADGFVTGDKIKVKAGVFMDQEGTIVRGGKKKVYVALQSLGQVMVVEFPAAFLLPQ